MRRFQTPVMTSKHSKAYEMVGRPSLVSAGPAGYVSRDSLVKLVAIMVALFIGVSAMHSLFASNDLVYGLMIDAGSTGSRIHTFTFHRHPSSAKLDVLHEDFHAIKPGLSHYKDNPAEAAQSLKPLLDRAMSKVPTSSRAATPVVLRATAGLRMVGDEIANSILKDVRNLLKTSDFRFDEDGWASILAGNEEGIYSWITVNYLMDRDPDNTVGTLEMGGGSSQVAYVPRDDVIKTADSNCSLDYEHLDYKSQNLGLYTVSHLNFGLQKARALALAKFEEQGKLSDNPCINAGNAVTVPVPFDESDKKLSFTGKGNYAECRTLVDSVLTNPAMGACTCDVCTYHSSAQPRPIPEYVAIAFYLERTVAIGMQSPLTVKDIREKGEEVCKMTVTEIKEKYPAIANGDATDLCFDLAYITLHLERGHGIHESSGTKLLVLDKIKDFELGWCLGAMQQTMAKLETGR